MNTNKKTPISPNSMIRPLLEHRSTAMVSNQSCTLCECHHHTGISLNFYDWYIDRTSLIGSVLYTVDPVCRCSCANRMSQSVVSPCSVWMCMVHSCACVVCAPDHSLARRCSYRIVQTCNRVGAVCGALAVPVCEICNVHRDPACRGLSNVWCRRSSRSATAVGCRHL